MQRLDHLGPDVIAAIWSRSDRCFGVYGMHIHPLIKNPAASTYRETRASHIQTPSTAPLRFTD
jgi:hypothetical protein